MAINYRSEKDKKMHQRYLNSEISLFEYLDYLLHTKPDPFKKEVKGNELEMKTDLKR